MLNLTGTSDLVRVVTSGTADIDVHVSGVERTDSPEGFIPIRQNTLITTASTTTILSSPASGKQRNAKFIDIKNEHASSANTVTVEMTDGTNVATLFKVTLAAGEEAVLNDAGVWFVYDVNGGVKMGASAASDTLAGVIMIASQAEMESGTDSTKAVTPGRAHFHPSASKAWGKAGITGNLLASYNMTSVTDTGVGAITFTIATDFSSANWSCVATIELTSTTLAQSCTYDSQAAGSVLLRSVVEAGSAADPVSWSMAGFGDI